MDHQGFHYRCTKTIGGGKRYYVCATPNVYCKGTAIQLENGTIIIKKPHSHLGNSEAFNCMKVKKNFRGVLVDRAKSETKSLIEIYNEEAIRNPQAAVGYAWPTAEASMRQARRQMVPPLPHTVRELGEYLDLNNNRYMCNNSLLYQGWINDSNDNYNIMFACQDLINAVVHQGATEMHADGTFKVVPSMPHCRQLFIIHLILQNHSIPVCFVLMQSKTEASYNAVLEKFKTKFPNVRPTLVMIDYETGLRNSFLNVYPEAVVSSCWFHYVQSLQKNVKKLGYTNYVKENLAAKMCVKMTAALALLPHNLIERGFQDIKTYAQDHQIQLSRFFTYFASFWIARKTPECFSVHGQPRRTNNNIESFHSTLKQTFQVMHPNLFTFLEHLKKITMKQHIIVEQLGQGLAVTRSIKMKYIMNSVRIKNSTALLSTGAITTKEFLLQCSHTTDRYLERELSWGDEHLSSEEEVQGPNFPIIASPNRMNMNANYDIAIENILEPEVNLFERDEVTNDPVPAAIIPALVNHPAAEINPPNNLEEEYDSSDFEIPEDAEMHMWQNFRDSDEYQDIIPFVRVPRNLHELYPQTAYEEDICIVCRVAPRTHAIIPCGHKVLCIDCLTQLEVRICPVCNSNIDNALRVWQ